MSAWSIDAARQLYGLRSWGEGYFDIDERGHVVVRSGGRPDHPGIDLYALSQRIKHTTALSWPVLVRFVDLLQDRVHALCSAFDTARQAHAYGPCYTAVYPIKVNQQRSVVEAILAAAEGDAQPSPVGLEAGSKPELMAVLALAEPGRHTIICNGYKDPEYMRLALIGRRLGHRIFIVIEKPSEFDTVQAEAQQLGVSPLLGLRVRLASVGAGNWQNTGGEKGKFGLSSAQLLHLVQRLDETGTTDQMQLLHFHMGSQIANIQDIAQGVREACRVYEELHALKVPIQVLDVGGGLGVDYEGSRSRSYYSINYTIEEYADTIVRAIAETCRRGSLPEPELITEAGRAMSAHHAVLITNVIDREATPVGSIPEVAPEEPEPLAQMRRLLDAPQMPPSELYHNATHLLDEARTLFNIGVITLSDRARTEDLYYAVCRLVRERIESSRRSRPALRDQAVLDRLYEQFADKYFCNFSLFQSIPDVWGIDQVFPIMPLHRLDEAPSSRGVIADLTCDSDGQVHRYLWDGDIGSTLALHVPRADEPYLLGIFLVGAYQEILGDLHNLFGDTDVINVEMLPNGSYRLVEPERGDTIEELLRVVHFEPKRLRTRYSQLLAHADLSNSERQRLLKELESGLSGYSYLED